MLLESTNSHLRYWLFSFYPVTLRPRVLVPFTFESQLVVAICYDAHNMLI